MAIREQASSPGSMVASENYDLTEEIEVISNRSITPDTHTDNVTYGSKCLNIEKIALQHSDNMSAISVESDYDNAMSDDVASTISNTNSCPEFTRKVEPSVFSEGLKASNQSSSTSSVNQSHKKVRRVPSGANPRHRVSTLYRPQRSHSLPQIQVNSIQLPRRLSQVPVNQIGLQNPQRRKSMKQQPHSSRQNLLWQQAQQLPQIHQTQTQQPSSHNHQQHQQQQQQIMAQPQQEQQLQPQQQQQQQQIIYLQIPQPGNAQSFDPEEIQQQISSQLHQLVPQICTQLLTQMGSDNSSYPSDSAASTSQDLSKTNSEENKSSYNQQTRSSRDSNRNHTSVNPRKRKKTSNSSVSNDPTLEIVNESNDSSSQQPQSSYSFVSPYQTMPQITIPITQELLLQCQQLKDTATLNFPYQPRLETIHEESLSLKHVKMSKYSKSKILACILTVLSVIVVIVLAGDRTVAVVVVTVIFIIFFLGLIGFLYLNSSKNQAQNMFSSKDNRNLQFGGVSTAGKSLA